VAVVEPLDRIVGQSVFFGLREWRVDQISLFSLHKFLKNALLAEQSLEMTRFLRNELAHEPICTPWF